MSSGTVSSDQDEPDIGLINYFCDEMVPKLSLNRELLCNWKMVLLDNVSDYDVLVAIIEEEIILGNPNNDFTHVKYENVEEFLINLSQLSHDVFYDFKTIMFELLINVLCSCYTTKIHSIRENIHHLIITRFLQLVKTENYRDLYDDKPLVLNQHFRLIVTLLELGCNTKVFQSIILQLLNSNDFNERIILLELLNTIMSKYPAHFSFIMFQRRPIVVPLNNTLTSTKGFAIHSWFKINDADNQFQEYGDLDVPIITLFTLANSSGNENSNILRIQLINYNQFMVEIVNKSNDDSNLQFSFNQILNLDSSQANEGYTHFVISYDNHANLNLFIDGEYSESIPCPALLKSLEGWNKLYIGRDENYSTNKDEFLLRNLTILDTDLSYHWINLFYHLGLGYDWNFKEFTNDNIFNLLNHLSFEGLANVSLKLKELTGMPHRRNSLRQSLNYLSLNNSQNVQTDTLPLPNKNKTNGITIKNLIDKTAIVNCLVNTKIKQSSIIFDSNEDALMTKLETPKTSQVLIHRSQSLHGAFYTIGGSALLLQLIETIINNSATISLEHRDTLLQRSLQLLFTVIKNNWRLSKEFDNICGYGILLILFMNYKNINKSLTFNLIPEVKTNELDDTLLKLIFKFVGYDFSNPQESIIINPNAYRLLILNFDLFHGSQSLLFLLRQLHLVMSESKHREFNRMELNKMKLLKKLLHSSKNPTLTSHPLSNEEIHEFNSILSTIIKSEISVETIKAVAHYIIYSFYTLPHECNAEFGYIALNSLTEIICNEDSTIKLMKKFSRSITLHWILLLFNVKDNTKVVNSKEVTLCAIRLLTKLLGTLGTGIIRKFFQVNHGLDVLTHYLKEWWSDDEVLCLVFTSAFGVGLDDYCGQYKSLVEIIPLKDDPRNQKFTKLVLPYMLNLLNNMVLKSVYDLSQRKGKVLSAPSTPTRDDINLDISLDAIHLINQYSSSIEKGYNNIEPLQSFYTEKEWLDGVFELVSYLRLFLTWEKSELLPNFQKSYQKLTRVLSNILISKLFKENTFFNIFNKLNESTKTLVLDIIFPRIFDHINEFISISKFIFNEREFFNESINLLSFYNTEYINHGFFINERDLTSYLTCILGIIELKKDTNIGPLRRLKSILGDLLLLKVGKVSEDSRTETEWVNVNSNSNINSSPSSETDDSSDKFALERYKSAVKFLLYRQVVILQKETLNNEQLACLIIFLLGNFFKLPNREATEPENLFNLLRTAYIMRQEDFPEIIDIITNGIEYSAANKLIGELFETLQVKNDEETLRSLSKFPTYKHIFNQGYYSLLSRDRDSSKMNLHDMISIALNNGGRLGQLENIYIKSFDRDCIQLKDQIINGELVKFNRASQDHHENLVYFANTYSTMEVEIERLRGYNIISNSYALDFIENSDRIRMRMVIEDQLSDSEKLSYNIDVPVKKVEPLQPDKSLDTYKYAMDKHGIDTLSLSTDDVYSDLGEESFEVIDDVPDASESDNISAYEDKNRKVLRSLYLGDHIVSLWNISQINGLAPIESLMILGSTHIYLIENYFHCDDGNVIDAQDAPTELRDSYLQLINLQSKNFSKNSTGPRSHRNKNWSLDTLSSISKRQFLLRDIALEMFFTDGASILLTCISSKERDSIFNQLHHYCIGKGLDSDLSQTLLLSSSINQNQNSGSFFASKIASAFSPMGNNNILAATKKWKQGDMSNFYYLMIINTLAGRTFNDLTQYPVFPWVIADYNSEVLDLSNPKTFRDLSKPMGAQDRNRANEFKERYDALDSLQDDNAPPFHYGTHYSSAMIVTSFLIRLRPYVQSYLLLQGGKFDHADRLFNSIGKAWSSASKDNTTDVRELIPEFFYLSEFMVNLNNFEFGTLQNGEVPNDVELPKWAHGDPKIFIQKNREALESPYVSANLHLWIDLIFGYKQSGPPAVDCLNVFHHLSYNGAINLDNINDDLERNAVIGMINNFGQTPNKIFTKPHPQKETLNLPNYYFTPINDSEAPKLVFESKLRVPMKKIEISSKSGKWVGRPACVGSEDDMLIRKIGNQTENNGSILINSTSFLDIHRTNITNILQIGYKLFLTGSEDGIINIWRCNLKPHVTLQFQGVLRGHLCKINDLKYSKSYKVGVSLDDDGKVIMWDFTRFKFIRSLTRDGNNDNSSLGCKTTFIDISNDSGNIAIVESSHNTNKVWIYTINGEVITTTNIKPGNITSMKFGSINDSKVETGKQLTTNVHTYWSTELISFAYGGDNKFLDILELKPDDSGVWTLTDFSTLSLYKYNVGDITTYELLKQSVVDPEDKLSRGYLDIIMGDNNGRVFKW